MTKGPSTVYWRMTINVGKTIHVDDALLHDWSYQMIAEWHLEILLECRSQREPLGWTLTMKLNCAGDLPTSIQ